MTAVPAPDPWAAARRRMVDEQLAARGIHDERVLAAMRAVPRHAFVPPESVGRAYDDCALGAAEGQTLSQPWIVARMLALAELAPEHTVLEIGTGTGYQTALLARLVAHVYSVERIPALVGTARARLLALGIANVDLLAADGTLGWQEFAPYARVLAAAAAPHVPAALRAQLADGGVLVLPVGGADLQRLEVWRRRGGDFVHERHGECRFVHLIGDDGWPETSKDREQH